MLGVMYVASAVVAVVVVGGVLGVVLVRGLGWWNAHVWDKEPTRVPYPERPVEALDWRQG